MTVLSDESIHALLRTGHPLVEPWDGDDVRPSSYDLHIGDTLQAWPTYIVRDPRYDQAHVWRDVALEDTDGIHPAWLLRPGIRYLAATRETVTIPNDCAGQIAARSSWGRDGLAVICGPAGYLDPGFVGQIVLELSVIGSKLVLWPGAAVAQLVMFRLDGPCARPYGDPSRRSKYQDSVGIVPSRLHVEMQP